MRKEICLVLGLLLALSAVGAAHAEDGIMPCYDYVSSVHASLNIDSGTASAVGKVYVGKKNADVDNRAPAKRKQQRKMGYHRDLDWRRRKRFMHSRWNEGTYIRL